jgi:Ca2+-transporting ATPase
MRDDAGLHHLRALPVLQHLQCPHEHGSAFNRQFFSNGKLWLALAGVLALQVMAVHWQPAQAIFGTVDLRAEDWLLSVAVASSVLLLDEARKLVLRLLGGARR